MTETPNKRGCSATPLILMMLPFFGVSIAWEFSDIYLGSGWWSLAILVGASLLFAVIVSLVMGRMNRETTEEKIQAENVEFTKKVEADMAREREERERSKRG